ncbi:WD40-repeat-containing domain protein [Zopfochytrium polystomum]|nr:WD40-repeat-containing domain protein [Zopfochytrium polystomum]
MATDTAGSDTLPQPRPADFRVIAGSYERLLYGLDGHTVHLENADTKADSPAAEATLTPVFIYPAHINAIKTLASSHRFLATGSSDEHIRLYDLTQRKEVGSLMHHSGTTTSLAFFRASHLLTAAEDGAIAIVRTSDWSLLKTLTGHKGATWDLTKGNCAYTLRLRSPALRVAWSPSGALYATLHDREVAICSTDTGAEVACVAAPASTRTRFTAMAFATVRGGVGKGRKESETPESEVVVVGCENGEVWMIASHGTVLQKWKAHEARVKDLAAAPIRGGRCLLATCSTDGGVRVWDVAAALASTPAANDTAPTEPFAPVASYEAKCRLTCISIMGVNLPKDKKKLSDPVGIFAEASDGAAETPPAKENQQGGKSPSSNDGRRSLAAAARQAAPKKLSAVWNVQKRHGKRGDSAHEEDGKSPKKRKS